MKIFIKFIQLNIILIRMNIYFENSQGGQYYQARKGFSAGPPSFLEIRTTKKKSKQSIRFLNLMDFSESARKGKRPSGFLFHSVVSNPEVCPIPKSIMCL